MRRIFAITAALTLCLVVGLATTGQVISRDSPSGGQQIEADRHSGGLQFEYQVGLIDSEGRGRYVSQVPALQSGQRFAVRLRAQRRVHAYLFVSDASGSFVLMTPEQSGHGGGTVVSDSEWTVLPEEGARFRLDNREGIERLYIVVANAAVEELEQLREATVPEEWLLHLRSSTSGNSLWARQQQATFVRASYTARGTGVVAVEDLSFAHR